MSGLQGRFEKIGSIGIIRISNPPVNAISVGVRAAIIDGVEKLDSDPALKAGILICEGRTFMAGADITEFGKRPLAPSLHQAIDAMESSRKPIVAAIHGTAFGGGLEVALACDCRIALESATIGFPEVKLGLLPGAGGTQRLPRLVGLEMALNLIVSGEPIAALDAARAGVIDAVVTGELIDEAVRYADGLIGNDVGRRKARDRKVDVTNLVPTYFQDVRKRLENKRTNLFATQRIVDALEAAATLPFEEGVQRERELFQICMANPQSKALRHVFFAERRAASASGFCKDGESRTVRHVGVIGAGTMGGGIVMNFLNAGIPVTLVDVRPDALEAGVDVIRKNYDATIAKGRLSQAQVGSRMALLKPTLVLEELADADLIIEAVFESMAIKKDVFAKLDNVVKQGAILASNTSYLSIDEIALATARPQDVVGMHFFSPANVMRLLELVRGARTAPDVLKTVIEMAKRINKICVVCSNRDGFIGNRMLAGYAYQAQLLGLEGAEPAQVDVAMRNFGFAMGPYQMSDLAGLDIGYKSRQERDPKGFDGRATRTADRLVMMGRLGQKTGAGYYDYTPGDRTPKPSALVRNMMKESAEEFGITPRSFTEEEIVERCMLALVNIGCEVLREGVAARPGDVDVVYVHGYGFPAYRGGPLYWAENELGLPVTLEKLEKLCAEQGGRWLKVSPLLRNLVEAGKGLGSVGD